MSALAMKERTSGDPRIFGLWPEMEALRIARLNVLLVGSPSVTEAVLDAIRSTVHRPVIDACVDVVSLPREGTVILHDVARLDQSQQRTLLAWLESPSARVVATSEEPLFDRVLDGSFSSELYYRLNTIMLMAATHNLQFPNPET